jgi:TP901 family phage tail tape measure protein
MAVSYVLNTVFNAVNRFSQPASAVNASMQGLNVTASQMQVRFNTLAPTLDNTGNKLMGFAKSTAIALGIMEGSRMAYNAVSDFGTALAKFRVVVNELNDTQFAKYEASAKSLARSLGSSYTDVANAYEAIAQINPEFAKTTESIDKMALVSIKMARVTGEETIKVAGDLTEIMTIFKMTGDQAMLAGNTLADAAAKGGASMDLIAESLKNVGATAVNAHLNLQQTSAMFETMALSGLKGAEAGTKLKGVLMKLEDTKVFGFKTGKFDALEALESFQNRLNSITNEAARFAYIKEVLGFERGDAGLAILGNIDYYKKQSDGLISNTELMRQSAIMEGTMAFKATQMANAFKNATNENTLLGIGFTVLGGIMAFITDHMQGLMTITVLVVGALMAYKTAIALTTLWNSNFVQGLRFVISTIYKDISALWMQTAATNAQTAAVQRMNVANTIAMLTLGALASFGIGLVFMAIANSADSATESVTNLDKSMTQLSKPISEAQIQLKKFLDLQKEVADRKDLTLKATYDVSHGNYFQGISAMMFKQSDENFAYEMARKAKQYNIPYEALTNDSAGQRYLDSLKSLMPSSSADSIVSNSPRDINYFSRTQSIERKDVKVTIENNSGNNVSVEDGKGRDTVLPFIGRTTSY